LGGHPACFVLVLNRGRRRSEGWPPGLLCLNLKPHQITMGDNDGVRRLSLRLQEHQIGTFVVSLSTCDITPHDAQRQIDEDHVQNLVKEFTKAILRHEPLVAIFRGNRADLPKRGEPVSNISLCLISGQHRLRAAMEMEDGEKWWNVLLYEKCRLACCTSQLVLTFFFFFEAVEQDPEIQIDDLIRSYNTAEPKVARKLVTPSEWFEVLYGCKSDAQRARKFDYLLGETRKHLIPMFTECRGEVDILHRFQQTHPEFFSNFSFLNTKERRGNHLARVSVFLAPQNGY
jgi:hypothetical protein